MCVLLSMLYYIQILKRAQEIEQEREDMKLGKILPSKSTSSDTLRSTRGDTRVSIVVLDSEKAKIEEESSDTGTSSIEVKEVRQIPSDQPIL